MSSHLSRLHRFIVAHFDLEDFRTLCFYLGVSFDNLRGEGHSSKVRELLLQMGRRRQLDYLLTIIHQSRPELDVPTSPTVLDALYDELPAFEASAGSPHQAVIVSSDKPEKDSRSGGVYFEGQGPVHIKGDIVGREQTKTSQETHFQSNNLQIGADTLLDVLFAALRQAVTTQAPLTIRPKALQRVALLSEAVDGDEPDLGLMESVLSWFERHMPSLVGMVTTIILHPVVVKAIKAVGEPATTEFRRRFNRLGDIGAAYE